LNIFNLFILHPSSIILISLLWLTSSYAQPVGYNHPELKWQTIETEHFVVHFHDGTERTAREIAGIAELVYKPITDLYNYEPDAKVHWIIRDHDDYSNGATYYYDQKIEIWATALDFELRGQHHWLYNVVTHEFTHMIQLGRARKGPRWLPQVYFQFFGYEQEKRPDVLYGYPNRIASFPMIGTVVPMWFAEGTAQFQARELGFDYWDSHRDMMMRTRVLSGDMLTINEMGVFASKNTFGNESVYNHGYAAVRYIAEIWGDDALERITASMSGSMNWTFNRSCRQVLGISERELYKRWQNDMLKDYNTKTAVIHDNIISGKVISEGGFGNFYPVFSPNGKKIAFISNKDKDYLSLGSTYIYDIEADSLYATKCPANGPIDWSPDGKFIVYSAKSKPNKYGSHFNDVYLWDIEAEKKIRLTKYARLFYPSFSPNGNKIIAVHNQGGTHNLTLIDITDIIGTEDISAETKLTRLTEFTDGTQIFQPRFSPDNKWIVCSTANLVPRDIYCFNLETSEWKPLIATQADERDPVFSDDGKMLYWSDDRTGIFNVYRMDLREIDRQECLSYSVGDAVTNVIGGAFMPVVSSDGSIAYAEFTVEGYGLSLINEVTEVDPDLMTYLPEDNRKICELKPPQCVINEAKQYSSPFGTLFIIPRLFLDKNAFKPGFYAMTSDLLEKFNLFGSAAMSSQGELDLYLDLQYRILYPTLYLQAYNIVRKHDQRFDDQFVIVGEEIIDSVAVPIYDKYEVDYKFNLTEIDIGAKAPVVKGITASAFARISEYKSALKFDDGGSFDYTYHKGRALHLRLDANMLGLSSAMDIHPTGGWSGWIEYARENNRFIEGFKIDAERGTLGEVFNHYNYHLIETDIDYYKKLFGDFVINPRLMAGVVTESVDSFYNLYAGGLIGMRGYSFYSMGGSRKALLRTSLRFPIITHIDKTWGALYLDRIHGALFAEVGDAWTDKFDLDNFKRDVGAELRFSLFSWYGFPTDLQLAAAYGLDKFTVSDDAGDHRYGHEWRWYMTLLFGFL